MVASLSDLVVEVLHNRGDEEHPNWSVGSGFFVGTHLVLTALHNVDGPGEVLIRVHGTSESRAEVRLRGDGDTVDLALLEVSGGTMEVPLPVYGAVDRTAPAVLKRCWAIGFPRFKEQRRKPKPLRLSVQIDGEISTGSNLDQQLLTLQVKESPRPLSANEVHQSQWSGISGAVVFSSDNVVVGVITEHHLPEGESALTVVPITAPELLPEADAAEWWKCLGITREGLVRLPGDIFDPYLRRLVYEYEHWSDFNNADTGSMLRKRSMMIQKMDLADLYREFIPLGIEYINLDATGWKATATGFVGDLETTWLAKAGTYAAASLLLILGDYGTGKSSYAIRLAYEIARSRLARSEELGLIPLYVDLSDYRRSGNIETFLSQYLRDVYQVQVDSARFRRLLEEGKLLLIFDGFDEMASRGSVDDTRANFREIRRLSLPGVKTVLTCRTHYFRSDVEVEQIIEGRSSAFNNPLLRDLKRDASYLAVIFRQFSDIQIRELIRRRAGGTKVDQIWGEIERRYNLLDLARRPVLLDLILKTIPILTDRQEIITVAHLYDAYTSIWIERDDWRSNVTTEGKRELAKLLAWRMMELWLRTGKSGVSGELENVSIDMAELLQSTGNAARQWLKSGGSSPYEDVIQLDYDVRTCSFLRRDADGRYSFSHRSFLEYFAALYLLDTTESPDSPLLRHRLASFSNSVHWAWPSPEVAAFMTSILRSAPERQAQTLSLTRQSKGSGGNGLTLVWEAQPSSVGQVKIGRNLKNCVAYALDLSQRDLTGADLSGSALASPCLEQTNLKGSNWKNAACRINHVYDVAFGSGPSTLLIASGNGMLSSWDLRSGTRTDCQHLKTGYIFDMSIHHQANFWAFTTWDGWIHLHRADDGRHVWSRDGGRAGKGKVILSNSGRYLAAGSWDGEVRVWDCLDGSEVGAWRVGDRVGCLTFDPSEESVLAAGSGELQLLRIGAKARTLASASEGGSFEACAYSPDGTLVAAASLYYGQPIRVFDVATGDIVLELRKGVATCFAMAFSPSATHLALGGTGLDIIELGTGRSVTASEPDSEIKAVRFSPDGARIISGGFDGVARVWDAVSGTFHTAVDVGINCYGADVAGAVGFGERSFILSADWEDWWAGAALRERLSHCGAVSIATDDPGARPREQLPCAVWDGSVYSAWLSALNWESRKELGSARGS